jgi:hypothetical protein
VIDEGVTGMIVDNIDQVRIALVQVAALDRRRVRRRSEERFTARRMANDYIRVYRRLVHHATHRTSGDVRQQSIWPMGEHVSAETNWSLT